MAKTAATIGDIRIAVESGEFPGAFNADKTEFNMPTLTYLNARGKTLTYIIKIRLALGDNFVPIELDFLNFKPKNKLADYIGIVMVESFQDGGKVRDAKPTEILRGVNIGKANETNCLSQAFKEAFSKYMDHKKKTTSSAVEAVEIPVRPPPMLLQAYNKNKQSILGDEEFKLGITVQRKFDGVRVVIYEDNGIVCYSRSTDPYTGFTFIEAEMAKLIENKRALFKSKPYFDGELYKFGVPLNIISGLARGKSARDTSILEYHIYDVFFPDNIAMPYAERRAILEQFFDQETDKVKKVDSVTVHSHDELEAVYKEYLTEGFEGAILRRNDKPYEYSLNGKHSYNVLKMKPIFDSEYEVISYIGGLKGKDLDAIIWMCKTENNNEFAVVPKMTIDDRQTLFRYLQEHPGAFEQYFKGQMLTIEYAGLSDKTTIPLQAKGKTFRTESEPLELDELIKKLNITV